MKELADDFRSGNVKLTTSEEMRNAIAISFKYGHVATAARILNLLADPSLDELADLAHAMKRTSQIIPLGIDARQHTKWRGWLKTKLAGWPWMEHSWHVLSQTDIANMLVLHEILVGRSLAILREAGDQEQRVLLQKQYAVLAESDLRGLLEAGSIAGARGPATVNLDHAQNWLQKVGHRNADGLGPPVCVWLAPIDESSIAVFLLAGGGVGTCCRWQCGDSIKESVSRLRMWLRSFASGSGVLPWDSFADLGRLIVAQANVIQPGTRWLMLAPSVEIGDLPWQILFEDISSQFVVSVVPNLSWAVLADERTNVWEREHQPYLNLSKAAKLAGLRERLEKDACVLNECLRHAAVVLGHGVPVPEAFPICFACKPMWVDEWLEVGEHRVCVVHSCFGGTAPPALLGDLGGIPGLVLGGQCRVLFAPVAEIPVEVALALHEHLTCQAGPKEIGLRYWEAVETDRRVGLYTLYGLADEQGN